MRIPVARYCFGALLWLPAIPVCNAAGSASPPSAISPAAQDLSWRMVGPFRGGRTRAVAGISGQRNPVAGVFHQADGIIEFPDSSISIESFLCLITPINGLSSRSLLYGIYLHL